MFFTFGYWIGVPLFVVGSMLDKLHIPIFISIVCIFLSAGFLFFSVIHSTQYKSCAHGREIEKAKYIAGIYPFTIGLCFIMCSQYLLGFFLRCLDK